MFKTSLKGWVPFDGDTFITEDQFIFNVFGYEHPENHVFAFLKYIPLRFKRLFPITFLERSWKLGKTELFRAEKLYTAENYQAFIKTFQSRFARYVYHCPCREKSVIGAPLSSVKKNYVPSECLRTLIRKRRRDQLQEQALDLINILSSESSIPMEEFGIHGSIALNMHSPQSDIDIVVYGSENFRRLEKAIERLVNDRMLSYVFSNRLDVARRFKGKYNGKIFMYNAVRKSAEVHSKYGAARYEQIKPLKFRCEVKDDSEAMFRPATYKILDYKPLNKSSELPKDLVPEIVLSMIGCYRNVARKGDKIEVSGMLERVEDLETGNVYYHVVIGTGMSEDEHIWPV